MTEKSKIPGLAGRGKPGSSRIGAAGTFYAAAQLAERHWDASPTLGNTPRTDIVAQHAHSQRLIAVQCKATTGKKTFLLNKGCESPARPRRDEWFALSPFAGLIHGQTFTSCRATSRRHTSTLGILPVERARQAWTAAQPEHDARCRADDGGPVQGAMGLARRACGGRSLLAARGHLRLGRTHRSPRRAPRRTAT